VRVANRTLRDSQERLSRRAGAGQSAVNDENFLIAKICDSESAHRPLRALPRLARTSFAREASKMRIQESAAAQAFPAHLTNADVGGVGVFCIRFSARRVVAANHAEHARVSVHQHFLKLDAVFFDVLVYSE